MKRGELRWIFWLCFTMALDLLFLAATKGWN